LSFFGKRRQGIRRFYSGIVICLIFWQIMAQFCLMNFIKIKRLSLNATFYLTFHVLENKFYTDLVNEGVVFWSAF